MKPIKVKVQPLTANAFEPYGRMLENREPIFPEVEPGEAQAEVADNGMVEALHADVVEAHVMRRPAVAERLTV